MTEEEKKRFIFSRLGLPVRLLSENYDSIDMPKVAKDKFKEKIYNAPSKGTLLISGTSGPVINQLIEMGRSVVGFSFIDHYESIFSDDKLKMPTKQEVVLVYSVGTEPAKNPEFSTRLINSIIDFYKNKEILLILETSLSPTNFSSRYGVTIPNSKALKLKKEELWI